MSKKKKVRKKMEIRQLCNGALVPSFKGNIDAVIETKCPGKWLIVDCEDGYIYTVGDRGEWKNPSKDLIASALLSILSTVLNSSRRGSLEV